MSDAINLQEAILKECRRDKVPVTLFLMNGFQLRGVITGYDSFVVVLVSAFLHIGLYLCVVFVNLARLFLLYQYGELYDFFGQIY